MPRRMPPHLRPIIWEHDVDTSETCSRANDDYPGNHYAVIEVIGRLLSALVDLEQ